MKFEENNIKMEDIRDDDSKTNKDSFEEINIDYDKRKNPYFLFTLIHLFLF